MENNQSYDDLTNDEIWEKINEKLDEMKWLSLTELAWSDEYKRQRGIA